MTSQMEEDIMGSRLVIGLQGLGELPHQYRASSLLTENDYDIITEKVGGFFGRLWRKMEVFGSISFALFMIYLIYKVVEKLEDREVCVTQVASVTEVEEREVGKFEETFTALCNMCR